jgi:C4-dicarboxylate-specific signal transduction histidine kinase
MIEIGNPENPKVLIVDDEAEVLNSLADLLRKDFCIFATSDAEEAMRLLASHHLFSVVISDQRMPVMTGVELLAEVAKTSPDTARILLTGYADITAVIEAVNQGQIIRYITKPWDADKLLELLRPIAYQHQLLQENRMLIQQLADQNKAGLKGASRRKAQTSALRENIILKSANRQLEQLLIEQSRLAVLGEMIDFIAHQWRQPLNSLGLLVQEAKLTCSLGGDMDTNVKKSMEVIQHMSQTIDTFRNFAKPGKEKVRFNVREEIVKTLSLIEGSFRELQIVIETNVKRDPVIEGYPGEFSQVLLNILINAKDVLIERSVVLPRILITIAAKKKKALITISDNAGGIPGEIIEKIFDPYFSTKGLQIGRGIGLYMSKTIIEKHMDGQLTVCNSEDGAKFEIVV